MSEIIDEKLAPYAGWLVENPQVLCVKEQDCKYVYGERILHIDS